MSLHNAADTCSANRSPNGLCCDGNDNNRNGTIDEYEPECNIDNSRSSFDGNYACSMDPMGDGDNDGIVNSIDPDCA